jgi:hypothetical protein
MQHSGMFSHLLITAAHLGYAKRIGLSVPQIALIRLYQHHTLRLVPGQEPLETRTTITMSPKHGVMVTVHPRP